MAVEYGGICPARGRCEGGLCRWKSFVENVEKTESHLWNDASPGEGTGGKRRWGSKTMTKYGICEEIPG
ncbi:hypothetical protein HanRHA438_Chr05g0244201 [Helianthus annuus]|nr:hypothetical protein HanRHA438_Chr05g0244201 [Helianthus annuus]